MNIILGIIASSFDSAHDWPVGTLMAAIMAILILVVIAYGLFIAVDRVFCQVRIDTGRVIEKSSEPSYITTVFTGVETLVPNPILITDEFWLCIEIGGQTNSVSVGRELYDKVSVDSEVRVEYVRGRLSGNIHVKKVIGRL